MGYALAEAARDRGAAVTLVSTIDSLPVPYGVDLVPVETVAEMREAVLDACKSADALIMAAAVSDFRPAEAAVQKIKKGDSGLSLDLVKNADFLHEVPDDVVKVAFAAETAGPDRERPQEADREAPRPDLRQRRLGLGRRLRGRHEPRDDPRPRRWP